MRKTTKNKQELELLTDSELLEAVRLMVSPEDLRDRKVIISILDALEYTLEDVEDSLSDGEVVHDMPVVLI